MLPSSGRRQQWSLVLGQSPYPPQAWFLYLGQEESCWRMRTKAVLRLWKQASVKNTDLCVVLLLLTVCFWHRSFFLPCDLIAHGVYPESQAGTAIDAFHKTVWGLWHSHGITYAFHTEELPLTRMQTVLWKPWYPSNHPGSWLIRSSGCIYPWYFAHIWIFPQTSVSMRGGRDGALGKWLGHEGPTPRDGLMPPLKMPMEASLLPLPWEDSARRQHL